MGGAPPYSYNWYVPGFGVIDQDRSITQMFFEPGTFNYILTVTDSSGRIGSDSVQITVGGLELPLGDIGEVVPPPEGGGILLPPETGEEGEPLGGGLLPLAPLTPLVPPPTTNNSGELIHYHLKEGKKGF